MSKYVIATIKSWNINNFPKIKARFPEHEFFLFTDKKDLSIDALKGINPDYVFFPHWSWIIPEEIYEKFNCVVFHMTDLPFGRGGSPLQNLIVRGIYETKISALKVTKEIDAGAIYMKESIDISEGNADEIFQKVSRIIFENMIPKFISKNITPVEQTGEPVFFKRRTVEQSRMPSGLSQRQIYDFIRMLDGEGYPQAYQVTDNGNVYYSKAKLIDGIVYADAEFKKPI